MTSSLASPSAAPGREENGQRSPHHSEQGASIPQLTPPTVDIGPHAPPMGPVHHRPRAPRIAEENPAPQTAGGGVLALPPPAAPRTHYLQKSPSPSKAGVSSAVTTAHRKTGNRALPGGLTNVFSVSGGGRQRRGGGRRVSRWTDLAHRNLRFRFLPQRRGREGARDGEGNSLNPTHSGRRSGGWRSGGERWRGEMGS